MDATAANSAAVNFGDAKGDVLDNIDNVVGSGFGDQIFGDAAQNRIYGGDGNDVLFGGKGIDLLDGGNGNDVLDAGSQNVEDARDPWATFLSEELHGGIGNDYLIAGANPDLLDGGGQDATHPLGFLAYVGDIASYQRSNAAVLVNLATGETAGGYAAGDTLLGIEGLVGSKFGDTLHGDSGANLLDGGLGNDTLTGGGGQRYLPVRLLEHRRAARLFRLRHHHGLPRGRQDRSRQRLQQ